MPDIQSYKAEIKSLTERKNKLDIELAKIISKRETISNDLKDKYGTTIEGIDSKIKELEVLQKTLKESIESKLTKAKEYISKLEGILNG